MASLGLLMDLGCYTMLNDWFRLLYEVLSIYLRLLYEVSRCLPTSTIWSMNMST